VPGVVDASNSRDDSAPFWPLLVATGTGCRILRDFDPSRRPMGRVARPLGLSGADQRLTWAPAPETCGALSSWRRTSWPVPSQVKTAF
jgi:hypothetical protein